MAQKLTMKFLSEELDTLRGRLQEMELDFERKLEKTLEKATEKLKSRIETMQDRPAGGSPLAAGIDAEVRQRLIAETAYLIAERRAFAEGNSEQDWLDAEKEVDNMLLQVVTLADTPKKTTARKAPRKASHV